MTAIEKAKELVQKFRPHSQAMFSMNDGWDLEEEKMNAKKCAIICVDEIQKLPNIEYSNANDATQYDYWQFVKQEINKL